MSDLTLSNDKMHKKLRALNESSSSGPDRIHPSVLKYSADTLTRPLSVIFIMSYTTNCLPEQWLTTHVTPIYKHLFSRLSTENYRPISLVAIVFKIFKSILKDEIMTHLLSNNLINSIQHSFLLKSSCQSILLETIFDWTSAHDKRDNINCIFIDFKKEFDSISHIKLLHKFNSYGFPLLVTKWIEAFLTDRTRHVKIILSNFLSSSLSCTSSVTQGSVLGPILFILFITDLTNICTFYATVKNIDANRQLVDLNKSSLVTDAYQVCQQVELYLYI